MDADKGCSVTFNRITYQLSVTKEGTGSGTVAASPNDLSWSGNTGTATYTTATYVTLAASAAEGSTFAGFTGDCIANVSPCSLTMDSAKSVTATFNLKADFEATPVSGEAPLLIQFTDKSAAGATSWLWDFGDGNTSMQQNPTHIYGTAGSYPKYYTVSLTANGATTTKTNYITLTEACSPTYFRCNGSSCSYPDLQTAYKGINIGDVLGLQAIAYSASGGLTLDILKTVTLKGGYDCEFTSNTGYTTISDKLTIKSGTNILENLIIK
jgi:PKD repeat protein